MCYFVMVVVIYSNYVCNIIFINYGHLTSIQGVQKNKICEISELKKTRCLGDKDHPDAHISPTHHPPLHLGCPWGWGVGVGGGGRDYCWFSIVSEVLIGIFSITKIPTPHPPLHIGCLFSKATELFTPKRLCENLVEIG